jgi:hypothetical protein
MLRLSDSLPSFQPASQPSQSQISTAIAIDFVVKRLVFNISAILFCLFVIHPFFCFVWSFAHFPAAAVARRCFNAVLATHHDGD